MYNSIIVRPSRMLSVHPDRISLSCEEREVKFELQLALEKLFSFNF